MKKKSITPVEEEEKLPTLKNPEESGASEEKEAPDEETTQETEEVVVETQETESFVTAHAKEIGGITVAGIVLILTALIIFRKRRKRMKEEVETYPKTEECETPQNFISSASLHEIGAREEQQDSYGISEYKDGAANALAVVADGMGGLTNGKAVSSLIVETCVDVFQSLPEYVSPADKLLQMAVQSNLAVNQLLQEEGKSGSTLVAATIGNGKLHFLSIGDSRIYLYRNGALLQLNREHVYREELAVAALNHKMSIHQANYDPQAKSLTSYLGIGLIPYLDRNFDGIKLLSKDKIILMSDGVFGTLSQEPLELALGLSVQEATEKIREMVQASAKPHQDNYTAVILEYHG